jgi:hypothetical protein
VIFLASETPHQHGAHEPSGKDAIVRGNRQAETESCRGDPPVAVVDFVSERVSDLGGR